MAGAAGIRGGKTDTQAHENPRNGEPFDEADEKYFEERETDKMLASLKGRQALTRTYRSQKGLCPICGEKITAETGFRIHAAQTRNHSHKCMVHPNCHDSLHAPIPICVPVS